MRIAAICLVALLAAPATMWAQSGSTAAAPGEAGPVVDAAKMGVSLDRIKRQLVQAAEQETQADGTLKLSFTVEVVGEAPKVDLLQGFSLVGPLQYGGPTHQDVIDFLTPQAYRSPVLPISSMAIWAAEKLAQRTKKQRCEQEIADYKQLLMSGVAVAAPRCTQ